MDRIAAADTSSLSSSLAPKHAKVISLLEGGYDVSDMTTGLSRCVNRHVSALRVFSTTPDGNKK